MADTERVVIERMGERGDGMAGAQAYPRTLPGEAITLREGRLEILQPSADRVAAFCPAFDMCGGCKLQHWQAQPYQVWKTNLLGEALKAHGIKTKINPLMEAHGAGRRRASLHVREVSGVWRAGFMAAGTHALVPLNVCPILVPALQNAPQLAARFGPLFGPSDVLVTQAENGIDVAIRAQRKLADKAAHNLAPLMVEWGMARIALNGETIGQVAAPFVLMNNAKVALPVGAFLQATKVGEETLATLVQSHLGKSRQVADLFCGLGPFSFKIAERCAVTAIDSDKPAIAALAQATRHVQGLRPIQAEARDLFKNPLTPMELNEFDAVVLDPPRAGAEAQCRNIAKSNLKRAISVACDVQTFARDAAILQGAGLNLVEVTPIDQFKYSAHLECVGLFTRR